MLYHSLDVKGETPIIKFNTEIKLEETPKINHDTETINGKMDLCLYDFSTLGEINNFADRIAKEVNEKETFLINKMLDKCGVDYQYLLDNRERFIYIPHGNAKSLFYCNHLMFTIMTEMITEEHGGYVTHFEYTVYVSEDNQETHGECKGR